MLLGGAHPTRQRLIDLIRLSGDEGIISSEVPKRYEMHYGEKLKLGTFKIKDLVLTQPGVAVSMYKGVQPRYVFDEQQAAAAAAASAHRTPYTRRPMSQEQTMQAPYQQPNPPLQMAQYQNNQGRLQKNNPSRSMPPSMPTHTIQPHMSHPMPHPVLIRPYTSHPMPHPMVIQPHMSHPMPHPMGQPLKVTPTSSQYRHLPSDVQDSLKDLGVVLAVPLGEALTAVHGLENLLVDTASMGLQVHPRHDIVNYSFHDLPLYDHIPEAYLPFEKDVHLKERLIARSFTVAVHNPNMFVNVQVAKVIPVFGKLSATVSIQNPTTGEDENVADKVPFALQVPSSSKAGADEPPPSPPSSPSPPRSSNPGERRLLPPPGLSSPGSLHPGDSSNQSALDAPDITTGKPLQLDLRVKIPAMTTETEIIHGYVIIMLQAEEKGPTPLYKRYSTICTGVKLRAFVNSNASKSAVLSSEAPSFVTNVDKMFFQLNGFNMHLPRLADPEMLSFAFGLAETYPLMKMLEKQYSLAKPIDQELEKAYNACLDQHLRTGRTDLRGAFEELLDEHEVFLAKHEPAYDETELALKRLQHAMTLEELQMRADARSYDLHCVEIKCEDHHEGTYSSVVQYGERYIIPHWIENLENYSIMKVSFTASGSSENRPAVAVGNIVKFRPVQEDWDNAAVLGQHLEEHFMGRMSHQQRLEWEIHKKREQLFQLEGVVTSFTLSTEVVVVSIFVPLDLLASENEDLVQHPCALELIRYHVRFEFDNTGFCYANQAINSLLYTTTGYAPGEAILEDDIEKLEAAQRRQNQERVVVKMANGTVNMTEPKPGNVTLSKQMQQLLYPAAPQTYVGGMRLHYKVVLNNVPLKTLLDSSLNEEQSQAVYDIYCMQIATGFLKKRISPYAIYGPPGTGKTTTVVKSIQSLIMQSLPRKILATAPSDAAADVLCLKLIEAETARCGAPLSANKEVIIIRLNWWKRVSSSVPIALSSYCHYVTTSEGKVDNSLFDVLDLDERCKKTDFAKKHRKIVIISTCGAAGMITCRTGFDYVFIDEASQAGEAETLVPCMKANVNSGVIVLAGDPKQLGVSSRSPAVRINSMLDRLLYSQAYSNFEHPCKHPNAKKMDPDSLVLGTYLKRNYRSHQDILELPSRMFYNSSLLECGVRSELDSIVHKWRVPRGMGGGEAIRTPALFVGLNSKHGHELGSPSFCNMGEVQAIEKIITSLLIDENISPPVKTSEICVICAFRAQTLQMRSYLRQHRLGNVAVGSPEDYQGQEKRVAIISTVLSSRPRMLSGISESYGLLSHPRRFNVSITRGKALSVVVGNPSLLLGDAHWREYIEAADMKGGYYGEDCPLLKRNRIKATHASIGDLRSKMSPHEFKRLYPHLASTPKSPNSKNTAARALGDGYAPDDFMNVPTDGNDDGAGFRINFDAAWRLML